MLTPRPRPSMQRFEELRRLYEREMEPPAAKAMALADAQYEAEERASLVEPAPADFIGVGSI